MGYSDNGRAGANFEPTLAEPGPLQEVKASPFS